MPSTTLQRRKLTMDCLLLFSHTASAFPCCRACRSSSKRPASRMCAMKANLHDLYSTTNIVLMPTFASKACLIEVAPGTLAVLAGWRTPSDHHDRRAAARSTLERMLAAYAGASLDNNLRRLRSSFSFLISMYRCDVEGSRELPKGALRLASRCYQPNDNTCRCRGRCRRTNV